MALNNLFPWGAKNPEDRGQQSPDMQEPVDDSQQTLPEGTDGTAESEPEPVSGEEKTTVSDKQHNMLCGSLSKISESLQFVLERQKEMNSQLENVIAYQEQTIRKQHESIARFQNDLLLKSQKDLIMEMIGIADQIQYTLEDQRVEPNYEKLVEDVKNLSEWVEASLNTVAVRKYIDTEDGKTELDRKRQEVTAVVPTEKEEEDGVLKHQTPGYIWAMPWLIVNTEVQLQNLMEENRKAKMFEFVLRPEQMVRLKYEQKAVNDADAPPVTGEGVDSGVTDTDAANDQTEE